MANDIDIPEKMKEYVQANTEWNKCLDYLLYPPDAQEILEKYPDADSEVLKMCEHYKNPYYSIGALYMRLRDEGSANRWAAMCSLQKGPVLSTDDTFFQGSKPLYDQFESQAHLDRYLKVSAQHGYTPDKNAVYFPSLARFRGDPEAYVTRAMGRSYIKKLLEKRGWSSEGGVNVKGRGPESDPLDAKNCIPLGEDIIRERAAVMQAKDPSLKRMNRRELREKIIEKHGMKG